MKNKLGRLDDILNILTDLFVIDFVDLMVFTSVLSKCVFVEYFIDAMWLDPHENITQLCFFLWQCCGYRF